MLENKFTRRWAMIGGLAAGTIGGLTLGGVTWARSVAVEPKSTIRLFSFPGSLNLLIWAGKEKGFFAKEGLEVRHDYTRTSMELVTKLEAGNYDIATSSIDNVIAYNSGQGQVTLPRPSDFFGFMNISQNMVLPLIVQGDIDGFEDLKGKTLAVDAISTGFSFVLRKILETHGLAMEDYQLVSVGNAAQRLESLKKGEHSGAILTPPFNRMAVAAGLKELGSNRDFTDNYQGTCFISSRSWAEQNPQRIQAFIRALLSTEQWLSNPVNHPEAAQILRTHLGGMSQETAERTVTGLVRGLSPQFNMAGIETVLALRTQFGSGGSPLGRAADFIDTSYLEKALKNQDCHDQAAL